MAAMVLLKAKSRGGGTDARFALPEVKIGIMPDYGETQRVARLMGKGPALTFNLSAEPMNAVTLSAEPIDAVIAQGVDLVDVLTDTGAAEAPQRGISEFRERRTGERVKLESFYMMNHGRIMEKLSSLALVVRCGAAWGRKVHVRSNATAGRPKSQ